MKNVFVHLRLHSNFSLAEGMLSFDYISKFCDENNQPAIAITDTSNLFGAVEFSLKMISFGIQPIIGMQVNICSDNNDFNNLGEVVLIAKNETGYQNLLALTSNMSSNDENIKYVNSINLEKYNEGLILLTGGVENGFIGKPASLNNIKSVNEKIDFLKKLFVGNLYIEIQRHGIRRQVIAEKILIETLFKR